MAAIEPQTINRARCDLAQRLRLNETEITEVDVEPADFPDGSLGAPVEDEMSAQVITPGWRIHFQAGGEIYEYRATERQLRLVNFKGQNCRV
ncbi:MAG TPA: hypothetical protein VFX97_09670 [Pyrinomonadaceae bacterium]|nr:hypothetical protein [Pyrinomonadaceae bacterium]